MPRRGGMPDRGDADTLGRSRMFRMRGDFLLVFGDQAAAERAFFRLSTLRAVRKRSSLSYKPPLPCAALARQGKRAEARDLLGPIYNWFIEGFDAPDLKDAKALLDELV